MRSFSDNVCLRIEFCKLELEVELELDLELERKRELGSELELELEPEPDLHFEFSKLELEVWLELDPELDRKLEFGSKLELKLEPEPRVLAEPLRERGTPEVVVQVEVHPAGELGGLPVPVVPQEMVGVRRGDEGAIQTPDAEGSSAAMTAAAAARPRRAVPDGVKMPGPVRNDLHRGDG